MKVHTTSVATTTFVARNRGKKLFLTILLFGIAIALFIVHTNSLYHLALVVTSGIALILSVVSYLDRETAAVQKPLAITQFVFVIAYTIQLIAGISSRL